MQYNDLDRCFILRVIWIVSFPVSFKLLYVLVLPFSYALLPSSVKYKSISYTAQKSPHKKAQTKKAFS